MLLTFKPNSIYNNYTEEGSKFISRIGDNEIRIENDTLTINNIYFGSVLDSRIIKTNKGRFFIDDKYRRAIKK